MPARRMWALISGLPEDAAVWRPDKPTWSQQDELIARLIEVTDFWGRATTHAGLMAASNFRLTTKPEFPEAAMGPIEHPGRRHAEPHEAATRRPRRRMTTAEMKKFFGGRR